MIRILALYLFCVLLCTHTVYDSTKKARLHQAQQMFFRCRGTFVEANNLEALCRWRLCTLLRRFTVQASVFQRSLALGSASTVRGSSVAGFVYIQSFCTVCERVVFHRSSALGPARTVGGSSVAGFVYIVMRSIVIGLDPFKCQPRDYCTVKCPGCRPRLLLRKEPGRLAGSVIVLLCVANKHTCFAPGVDLGCG